MHFQVVFEASKGSNKLLIVHGATKIAWLKLSMEDYLPAASNSGSLDLAIFSAPLTVSTSYFAIFTFLSLFFVMLL